ncbi:metal ABC transporter solute-binding protein, Zn/Mn family [Corynebacterium mendelii]|uniref:Zinc ABC transporter substrate-binding protein n=1 Tax=Corynebacterium mendelii TaxID=2765362 RepID=A0A939ITP6_9CORY|nr:metal ABC transporter substrate-binding protein [Corynebacterium mendelii]MBN9644074.1 zinc ABC transporter substrate-binding protein [Corynebacterium mendelii]
MKAFTRAAIALCATAPLVLAGCSGSGDDASTETSSKESTSAAVSSETSAAKEADADKDNKASAGEAVKVVATTTQICDYVTQIATDNSADAELAFVKTGSDGQTKEFGAPVDTATSEIDLTCLLAPNASAHDHEMTPQQMKALGEADLFMVSGVDLEHFLDKAVESSGFKGTMVVTAGVLTADEVEDANAEKDKEGSLPYKVFRGDKKVDVEKWPFLPEEGEEPEFKYDPHVWTSPGNAEIQVHNIGLALEQASPENKELFKKHVHRYEEQLQALDKWANESLETIPAEHRVLFTSHDAFGYFSNHYDVKFIGAALSDFNEQADATADHIASEAKKVQDSGAVALFAENSNNSKSIEAIANAAGVRAVMGDDALYGDSLGPDGSDGETYIGSILHNVTNLVTAWDGTVAPIPDSIKEYAPKDVVTK